MLPKMYTDEIFEQLFAYVLKNDDELYHGISLDVLIRVTKTVRDLYIATVENSQNKEIYQNAMSAIEKVCKKFAFQTFKKGFALGFDICSEHLPVGADSIIK